MNLILGGGFYRLDLNLREGKGWTYGARSTVDSRRDAGTDLGGRRVRRPAHRRVRSRRSSRRCRACATRTSPTSSSSRAKDQIIKSFPARFATRANVAAQLAELAVFGLPDSYVTDYTKKIAAVTKDDVRRVARKYLDPNHLTIVVVGDRKTLAEPLAKLARSRSGISTAIRSPAGHDRGHDSGRCALMPTPAGRAAQGRGAPRGRPAGLSADAGAERGGGDRQGRIRLRRRAR